MRLRHRVKVMVARRQREGLQLGPQVVSWVQLSSQLELLHLRYPRTISDGIVNIGILYEKLGYLGE